jgi:hypothetical protein
MKSFRLTTPHPLMNQEAGENERLPQRFRFTRRMQRV